MEESGDLGKKRRVLGLHKLMVLGVDGLLCGDEGRGLVK